MHRSFIVLPDFVLVYEEELCAVDENRTGNTENLRKSLVDKAELWRQKFRTNLLRNGVHIEEVCSKLKPLIRVKNYVVVYASRKQVLIV